jgi:hypothetical protein
MPMLTSKNGKIKVYSGSVMTVLTAKLFKLINLLNILHITYILYLIRNGNVKKYAIV